MVDGKKVPPSFPPVPPDHEKEAYGEVKFTLYIQLLKTMQYIPVSVARLVPHSTVQHLNSKDAVGCLTSEL